MSPAHEGLEGAGWRYAGRLDFATAQADNLVDAAAVEAGAPGRVLMFEPAAPVLTLGRRIRDPEAAGLTPTLASCAARGIEVVPVDRGGQATLHLPGQLVLFIALPCERVRVLALVDALLEGVEEVVRAHGADVERGQGQDAGLWWQGAKLTSVGLRHVAGVARHGVAVNVKIAPDRAAGLVLCGHGDAGYRSLHQADPAVELAAISAEIAAAWGLPATQIVGDPEPSTTR